MKKVSVTHDDKDEDVPEEGTPAKKKKKKVTLKELLEIFYDTENTKNSVGSCSKLRKGYDCSPRNINNVLSVS